jgi:hypothetical protein
MFSWIRRLTTRPADLRLDGPGDFDFEIVGEASYQDALEALAGGGTDDGHSRVLVTARLVHEDGNPHDDQAVRVDVNGRTVAYLTRASARIYRRWLAKQGHAARTATCSAVIVGGWDRGRRGRGHFGIKLDLPSLY